MVQSTTEIAEAPIVHQKPDAAALLTSIIDYFATAKEGPGDFWAHPDDFSSYCLDHQARDGTKFWIDLDKDGTITLLWKPAGQASPEVMKFRSPTALAEAD